MRIMQNVLDSLKVIFQQISFISYGFNLSLNSVKLLEGDACLQTLYGCSLYHIYMCMAYKMQLYWYALYLNIHGSKQARANKTMPWNLSIFTKYISVDILYQYLVCSIFPRCKWELRMRFFFHFIISCKFSSKYKNVLVGRQIV